MDYSKESLKIHKEKRGKIEIKSKIGQIHSKDDLSTAYSPGVGAVSSLLHTNPTVARDYTVKGNTIAVVSDGSAVLGLGNIGPLGALPVMEGKALLFKEFADVDAYPIVLDTQDTEHIVSTIKNIAPTFAGINLEDISAPRCFEIEERLKSELDIPVFHDDQHGTAIVVLAGIINALRITERNREELKVTVNGSGASGVAVTKLLLLYGFKNIVVCDSKGVISSERTDLNISKSELLKITNPEDISGTLTDAVKDANIFIGLSAAGALTEDMIRTMSRNPIIFALANPVPEIMPDRAKHAGAMVVATGRSDFPNQVNNVLAFPGVFRGALDNRVTDITDQMKINAAKAIADCVDRSELDTEKIIPSPLDKSVAQKVADRIVSE
jgi:malate dehydrogenase (oxaloacetate-decarboxylating)